MGSEAELMRQLKHPNIVQLQEVLEESCPHAVGGLGEALGVRVEGSQTPSEHVASKRLEPKAKASAVRRSIERSPLNRTPDAYPWAYTDCRPRQTLSGTGRETRQSDYGNPRRVASGVRVADL